MSKILHIKEISKLKEKYYKNWQVVRKLVKYYKSALKFSDVEDVNVIKPEYDKNCYGLLQEISDLKENKSAVWETFSDI